MSAATPAPTLRPSTTALLLCALSAALAACGSGGNGFIPPEPFVNPPPPAAEVPSAPPTSPTTTPPSTPPPSPQPPGLTTTAPRVPFGINPPIGLTWHIGLTENVAMATLMKAYSLFSGVNTALWDLTEGQVYVYRMEIWDNVGPGTTPKQWEANKNNLFPTSNLDVVLWPAAAWDLTGTAAAVWHTSSGSFGRTGNLMIAPESMAVTTGNHEASHLIWQLSWKAGFSLHDEYLDGVQDTACIMESSTSQPTRWCAQGNHVAQSSQPHSCWTQILADYKLLTHTGSDKASSSAWVPLVEYHDTP